MIPIVKRKSSAGYNFKKCVISPTIFNFCNFFFLKLSKSLVFCFRCHLKFSIISLFCLFCGCHDLVDWEFAHAFMYTFWLFLKINHHISVIFFTLSLKIDFFLSLLSMFNHKYVTELLQRTKFDWSILFVSPIVVRSYAFYLKKKYFWYTAQTHPTLCKSI